MFDQDCFACNVAKNYIQRSAAFMKSTIKPGLDESNNHVDRHIRLVLTENGPEYHNVETLTSHHAVRRLRNLYYTRGFAELVRTETMLCRMRMRTIMTRMIARMTQHNSPVATLLPTRVCYWWPLVEDLFASETTIARSTQMFEEYIRRDELAVISVDATFRCCLSIAGQASFRAPKAERAQAAFDGADALRRVLTVRGRTGAVIGMRAVESEKSSEVKSALTAIIPEQHLKCVAHVSCDNPSSELLSALDTIFPKLVTMSIDTLHLAIVYENAMWKKRSLGSTVLRQILSKFHRRRSH